MTLFFAYNHSFAQLPTCVPNNSGGLIYFQNGVNIYNWNPSLPFSATNPTLNTITLPANSFGLAVSNNLNNPAGPSPTFYSASGNNIATTSYIYYNGATWINTGHIAGCVNIGGGGGPIYGYTNNAPNFNISRYDGTGNAVQILNITDFNSGGPADLQGESGTSNFYVLKISAPGWLRKYDGNGNMIYQWTVNGGGPTQGGAGFAILNGTIYALTQDGLFSGLIGATNINLAIVPGTPLTLLQGLDMAACFPGIVTPPVSMHDTIYLCSPTATTITTTGTAPFSYNVLSGSPTITGNGPDYTVTTSSLSTIVFNSNSGGNSIMDTFTIVPAPVADAGMNDTLIGCNEYSGVLNATMTNTQPWITYTYAWTPVTSIQSGGNTLSPTIQPTANTTYFLTASTDNEHGNCNVTDSVQIIVRDESVTADFAFDLTGDCNIDSVHFTNLSQNATHYSWNFGDGSTSIIDNPIHSYNNQGIYNVTLKANNAICQDSVIKVVDNTHSLTANFTTDVDTVCQGTAVNFTNASLIQFAPGSYQWNFGDGSNTTDENPSHSFANAGIYPIRLIVSDAIPCSDTMTRLIVVDSLPIVRFSQSQRSVCLGIPVHFDAQVTGNGITNLIWDFNDGTTIANVNSLTHAYDETGTYYTTLKATYRACPESSFMDSVVVHPLPIVNIGPDTAICLGASPIVLANTTPAQPNDRYLWNTGGISSTYAVTHHGTYTLTVTNEHDCSTSDVVEVSKDCYIDIPNAFTPNGDGIDDYFFPRQLLSSGVVGFNMQIFNRWGQIVFETNTADGRGWDGKFNGKDQPQGVFIYMIDVVLKNGRTERYTGNVTLIR